MLRPEEISVGTLRNAPRDVLSLLLPRDKYEEPILIAGAGEDMFALFLGGGYPFHGFECSENDSWKGLLVHGVSVELDEASLQLGSEAPAGSLIREGTSLSFFAHIKDPGGFVRTRKVPLLRGLAPSTEGEAASFLR